MISMEAFMYPLEQTHTPLTHCKWFSGEHFRRRSSHCSLSKEKLVEVESRGFCLQYTTLLFELEGEYPFWQAHAPITWSQRLLTGRQNWETVHSSPISATKENVRLQSGNWVQNWNNLACIRYWLWSGCLCRYNVANHNYNIKHKL